MNEVWRTKRYRVANVYSYITPWRFITRDHSNPFVIRLACPKISHADHGMTYVPATNSRTYRIVGRAEQLNILFLQRVACLVFYLMQEKKWIARVAGGCAKMFNADCCVIRPAVHMIASRTKNKTVVPVRASRL